MDRDFRWRDGERLIAFATDLIAQAPELLFDEGFSGFALITTPRALPAAGPLADACAQVVYVPHGEVPQAAAAVRAQLPPGRPVVALGGGRVIDAAKAVGAADGNRVCAIPTTLSGAELTGFHRLPTGVAGVPTIRPALVLCDPLLMTSQPRERLAASALNAMAHAVEALWVSGASPVPSLAGRDGARRLHAALLAEPVDREGLALGSLLGAYALGATGYGLHHVLCQSLVRCCGLPHAPTNAVVLPHVVRLMARLAPEPVSALARELGGDAAEDAADQVAAMTARCGVVSLRALGLDPATLPAAIEAALARSELARTPGVGRAELEEVCAAAAG